MTNSNNLSLNLDNLKSWMSFFFPVEPIVPEKKAELIEMKMETEPQETSSDRTQSSDMAEVCHLCQNQKSNLINQMHISSTWCQKLWNKYS